MAATYPRYRRLFDSLGAVAAIAIAIAMVIRALAVAIFELVILTALVGVLVQLARRMTNS